MLNRNKTQKKTIFSSDWLRVTFDLDAAINFTAVVFASMFPVISGCTLRESQISTSESICQVTLSPDGSWGRHAWEDSDGVRRNTSVAFRTGSEHHTVEIDYSFGSAKATQVHVDLPLIISSAHKEFSFELMGDGSGNQIQLWLNGLGGKWHKQGGDVPLSTAGWLTIRGDTFGTPTDIARRARFVIVQKGGASKGTIRLRNLMFSGTQTDALSALGHIFAEVPNGLPYLEKEKVFRIERKRVDDRTVLLIDGDPLFCVLDASLDPEFLRSARQAGVNTLAIDLYWRDLEPRAGYADWERLEEQITAYGRCGFALIFLVNIHQPTWVVRQAPDEPTSQGCVYPNTAAVRKHFSEFLEKFIKHTSEHPNVLAYGLSAGGEADCDFHEVNGDSHVWRKSQTCLGDFRTMLRKKYSDEKVLRTAWGMSAVSFDNATPVAPLGPYNKIWRDIRTSAHDWREFVDHFWLNAIEWQAQIVRKAAPEKLILARLSWPVFQTFNPFLAPQASDWLDMLQVKDAVPTWEQTTPVYLRSRAAIFQAATRGTDIVNFPEVDVGHNHGAATAEQIAKFLPSVAEFSGGIWYYRSVKADQWVGIANAGRQAKQTMLTPRPPIARRVAIFYAERYANWVQNHSEYDNEDSLAGVVRTLDTLGIPFDIISEDCLTGLDRYRHLIITAAPYMPQNASDAIAAFIGQGGRVLAEEDDARFDLQGHPLNTAWKDTSTRLPADSLKKLRPKEDGITISDNGRVTMEQIKNFLQESK